MPTDTRVKPALRPGPTSTVDRSATAVRMAATSSLSGVTGAGGHIASPPPSARLQSLGWLSAASASSGSLRSGRPRMDMILANALAQPRGAADDAPSRRAIAVCSRASATPPMRASGHEYAVNRV